MKSLKSLNVAIDGRPLMHERSGIGRYTYQLILALFEINLEYSLYLYGLCQATKFTPITSKQNIERIEDLIVNIGRNRMPFPFRKVSRLVTSYIKEKTQPASMDVVLWTNFIANLSAEYKSIITIHDMAHYYYPQYTVTGFENDLNYKLGEHALMSDLILCVSENTKRDVINILGIEESKIWVTYNGVSEGFRRYQDKNKMNDLRSRFTLPERFILFVGTVEPRKNLIKLIEAYQLLHSQYGIKEPMVIVGGKGWKNEPLYQRIKEMKIDDHIIFTGYVSDDDLPLFYNAATVFAYPSLYEGFGIPVIEAMACGVPVVTSNVSSLPEVAGDAAVLVNPEEPEEIAAAIYRIMIDEDLYESLREKGFKQASKFTWEACAKKTLEAISHVI